jgi:RNA polymerase-binding protein DksA
MTGENDPRALLEAERQAVIERLGALERDFDGIVEASGQSNADDEHDPEGATIAFERQHIAALLSQGRHQLRKVEEAIARLDVGSYGKCQNCGRPIGAGRLAARPTATTCITCAGRSAR